MNRAEQISKRLSTPIKTGDKVDIRIPYTKKTTTKVGKKYVDVVTDEVSNQTGIVTKIIKNKIHGLVYEIETNSTSVPHDAQLPNEDFDVSTYRLYKAEWVKQNTSDCGFNPFKSRLRVNFISSTIDSLFFKGGYGRRSNDFSTPEYKIIGNHPNDIKYESKTYGGINFNPYVVNKKGEKEYFQRDLVWTQEQKQLLIHSIYNGIEIGKFIFKYNSWSTILKQIDEMGHGYDFECIDGKQRYHAILEFAQDKFPDEFGNYFSDLSTDAHLQFYNYNNLAVGELDEKSGHKEILNTFLMLNFTGTPISREHIEYVQSIKL